MRPVKSLFNGRDDQIGPFEQVYLNIACVPEEIEADVSTHVEHNPTNFLSILANLTPFSDFNQVNTQPDSVIFYRLTSAIESSKYLSMSGMHIVSWYSRLFSNM